MDIRKNYLAVCEKIAHACESSDRNPADVALVAVTKTFPAETVLAAIDAGISIVGENKIQEAVSKYEKVGPKVNWHYIGHLQTNKVKQAVKIFNVIESVDSLRLAKEIDTQSAKLGKVTDIFVQVNTSGEDSKFGIHPNNVMEFITQIKGLQHINITGLMTIAAFSRDEAVVRPGFQRLYSLRDDIRTKSQVNSCQFLSMGMSNDYQIAIAEGATHVRIGRALFGERTKH